MDKQQLSIKPTLEDKIMIERLELVIKKLTDKNNKDAVRWAIRQYWEYKKKMVEQVCQQTIELANAKRDKLITSLKNEMLLNERKEMTTNQVIKKL
jgi:hypothetical protein|tara:strand:- start:384 stop:671 length:288 start_codon:yes stop_codon:yes gene_type:complete